MQMIGLGKAGSITVDESKFNEAVRTYIFNYGLKQMLNDVHASEKDLALKPAMAQKKLDSLYAGEVAQPRGATGNPVERKMRELAEIDLKAKVKAAGKKVSDYEKSVWQTVIGKQVEARKAAYQEAAEKILAVKVEPVEGEDDFDIMDLIDEAVEETSGDESEQEPKSDETE